MSRPKRNPLARHAAVFELHRLAMMLANGLLTFGEHERLAAPLLAEALKRNRTLRYLLGKKPQS